MKNILWGLKKGLNTNNWNLKKKVSFFLSLVILITSIITLVCSMLSATYYLTRQSKRMSSNQLNTMASNYSTTLSQYEKAAIALIINPSVQQYCINSESDGVLEETVYNYIFSMLNMQNDMNFAVVLKDKENYVFKGNSSMADSKFNSMYEHDYKKSIPIKEASAVRISYNQNYFKSNINTVTVYYPIYSVSSSKGRKIGMLVLNYKDNILDQLYEESGDNQAQNMFITDRSGETIFSGKGNLKKDKWSYSEKIVHREGSFHENGLLINYKKIGEWNFCFVNEIPIWNLYKECLNVVYILFVIMAVMTSGSLFALRKMLNTFYKPINKVVIAMDDVSEGYLEKRIDINSMDVDSLKLATGFNSMMDKIYELMEQVKEEQHQLEETKFNALYSQIKPHFLYNTLECIHWQAVSDKNHNISVMVKALAQYYRLCLSQGKEIIHLRQEIEHIQCYLIIQNMRYGNIIEMENQISEEFYDVEIPKMTLQPIIENAIYHGFRITEYKLGKIVLTMERVKNGYCLVVSDNGVGMENNKVQEMNQAIERQEDTFGYGIQNVNRRIVLMFGKEYGIYFKNNNEGGVSVEINLPIKEKV